MIFKKNKNPKKNLGYKKYKTLILIVIILIFSPFGIAFCEEADGIVDSNSEEVQFDFKKIFLYTISGIIIIAISYYLFSSGSDGDSGNIMSMEEVLEFIKDINTSHTTSNIPANYTKPIPIINPGMMTPHDHYIQYDCYKSVNIHLANIGREIATFQEVYERGFPIVHMSNTILNEIHLSTKIGLKALKTLPKDSLVAFAHFNPSFGEIYYQILTGEELQKVIEKYNITKIR